MIQNDPEILAIARGSCWRRTVIRYEHGGAIVLDGHTLTVHASFPGVDLLFWMIDGDRLLISGDSRMIHRAPMEIDPAGVLSILLFGAVVPPLSLYKNKRTFVPGFRTHFDLRTFRMWSSPDVIWPDLNPLDDSLPTSEQVRALAGVIDSELEESCGDDPVLLFSGGVDSSVLAYRLQMIGKSRTALVHYSFGEDSPDTKAARTIAGRLGFDLEVLGPHVGRAADVLDHAGDLYHQPFCDHSAVNMHHLANHVVSRFGAGRPVLDGTGADGAFGLFAKARKYRILARVPYFARALAGYAYERGEFWHRTGSLELALRIGRRLATMPKLSASIAQHAMLGIGLKSSPDSFATVTANVEAWMSGLAPGDDRFARIPMADIGLICAGVFAHKNFSHFADAGSRVRYPFLSQRMVRFALRRAQRWPGSMTPKNALKTLLMQVAPREAVHRAKTGFVSPKFDLFSSDEFLQRFESAFGSGSPVEPFVEQSVCRTLVDDLRSGRRLPPTTYNFAWSIAMTASWLRGMNDASLRVQRRSLERHQADRRSEELTALIELTSAGRTETTQPAAAAE